jgi:hypothetical protein
MEFLLGYGNEFTLDDEMDREIVMKQTDMNQLLDMVTEQRNKAEAEVNLLNTLILDKIREVAALEKENTDLREALHSEIYS